MVLHNGRPNDILSVSRDARANSTSQSTALFPTVILAGYAPLAICIGKPCGTLLTSHAAHVSMDACMLVRSHASPRAYDFRPLRSSRGEKAAEATRDDTKSILGRKSGCCHRESYETRGDVMVFLPRQIVLLAVDSVPSTSSIFSRPN